jgi:hypothetical protein
MSIDGMQLAAGEHMPLNRIHQQAEQSRAEQIAGADNPAGQRGAGNLHVLTGIDRRLRLQRQTIMDPRNVDTGQ